MKIWTITYDDENGVDTLVVNTEAEAETLAKDWLSGYWRDFPVEKPMPEDWREAYDALCETPCFMDSISVVEHNIFPPDNSENPYVKAAQRIHTDEGTLEIDDNALVSNGDDSGAYVSAWVWVYDDQVRA